MDKKIIIYVGNFSFPYGNASGKRVYGNGKLFRSLGYTTIFVGTDAGLSYNTDLKDTKKVFDGFEYYNFPYPKSSLEWTNYRSILKRFITWMQDKKEATFAIIYYGSPRLSLFISGLIYWSKKNNIKIIADCVDWLESKTGNFIFDIAKTVDTYYQKAIANKHSDGVICISSYLANYYKKAGKKTVIIPPLSTHISKDIPREPRDCIYFVYAGSPFRGKKEIKDVSSLKDRVDKMMELLKILKDDGIHFKLFYYGLDKGDYLTAFPGQRDIIDYLENDLEFCGHQDNETVTAQIEKSDFTILLRDKKRATMAGFPTKISESISYGTPVITTRTSDIEYYLTEGEQVVFVELNNLKSCAQTIEKTILSKKYIYMKHKCIGNRIFFYKELKSNMNKILKEQLNCACLKHRN